MHEFFSKYIVYDRADVCNDAEQEFFRAIGVPADWLEEYVEVAPRWSGGMLQLRHSLHNDVDALEKGVSSLAAQYALATLF